MTVVVSEADVALVTYDEAATNCGVPPWMVRDWKRRGLIVAVDTTIAGRPLFSMAQVWDAEHKTRRGRGRKRRSA